ncbi:MAG: formate-dependent phosphoribosylglycinamide formyltransferase [Erythrobacter sp.]
MNHTASIMLLGSGELGREFTISAKRLGAHVVACDAYGEAPAMQVADAFEVFSMLDADALRDAVQRHKPDFIVPEIEAIRTEVLAELEEGGYCVVPTARATQLTMNRDKIRDLAAKELGLETSRYHYAETLEEVRSGAIEVGFPCVIKPVMSSSGKGQSTLADESAIDGAWDHAVKNMRGDRQRVIVEQFVEFDYEITLLTIRHARGISFCPPIGHRQARGDYQESWQPAEMSEPALSKAKSMAIMVVEELGGYGLFGVEFFIKGDDVFFSELSPRPHDTGMVTLASQRLTEFDLHARAILGLPIPDAIEASPAASAVILADRECDNFEVHGVADALSIDPGATDIRIFGKPVTRPYRRMGVALANARDVTSARRLAAAAASKVTLTYRD